MRKKNLSVYDIQQELATQGHTISINSLSVLLREEGFARVPRRRDEERFLTLRRRTRQLLGELYARPNSAWRRITLRSPRLERLKQSTWLARRQAAEPAFQATAIKPII